MWDVGRCMDYCGIIALIVGYMEDVFLVYKNLFWLLS